jgi:hypothetical protein
MILEITKLQLQRLLEAKHENFKPALEFDKIHGTSLSQSWDFKKGITTDDVWDIIQDCFQERKCRKLGYLVEDLDEDIFPYPNVKSLPIETKISIIQGMASELNYDDIVHFAIENKTGLTDKKFNKFHDSLSPRQQHEVQWVSSPKTTKIIKNIFKNEKKH